MEPLQQLVPREAATLSAGGSEDAVGVDVSELVAGEVEHPLALRGGVHEGLEVTEEVEQLEGLVRYEARGPHELEHPQVISEIIGQRIPHLHETHQIAQFF